MRNFRGEGLFNPPFLPWVAPKRPILNRVKMANNSFLALLSKFYSSWMALPNSNQHPELLFSMMNLHWHIKLTIYIKKNKFASHKQYAYVVLPSLEIQKRLIQTKFCYSVWKETTHKHSKVTTAKNVFYTAHVTVTTRFDKCFLFHVITGRHCFL